MNVNEVESELNNFMGSLDVFTLNTLFPTILCFSLKGNDIFFDTFPTNYDFNNIAKLMQSIVSSCDMSQLYQKSKTTVDIIKENRVAPPSCPQCPSIPEDVYVPPVKPPPPHPWQCYQSNMPNYCTHPNSFGFYTKCSTNDNITQFYCVDASGAQGVIKENDQLECTGFWNDSTKDFQACASNNSIYDNNDEQIKWVRDVLTKNTEDIDIRQINHITNVVARVIGNTNNSKYPGYPLCSGNSCTNQATIIEYLQKLEPNELVNIARTIFNVAAPPIIQKTNVFCAKSDPTWCTHAGSMFFYPKCNIEGNHTEINAVCLDIGGSKGIYRQVDIGGQERCVGSWTGSGYAVNLSESCPNLSKLFYDIYKGWAFNQEHLYNGLHALQVDGWKWTDDTRNAMISTIANTIHTADPTTDMNNLVGWLQYQQGQDGNLHIANVAISMYNEKWEEIEKEEQEKVSGTNDTFPYNEGIFEANDNNTMVQTAVDALAACEASKVATSTVKDTTATTSATNATTSATSVTKDTSAATTKATSATKTTSVTKDKSVAKATSASTPAGFRKIDTYFFQNSDFITNFIQELKYNNNNLPSFKNINNLDIYDTIFLEIFSELYIEILLYIKQYANSKKGPDFTQTISISLIRSYIISMLNSIKKSIDTIDVTVVNINEFLLVIYKTIAEEKEQLMSISHYHLFYAIFLPFFTFLYIKKLIIQYSNNILNSRISIMGMMKLITYLILGSYKICNIDDPNSLNVLELRKLLDNVVSIIDNDANQAATNLILNALNEMTQSNLVKIQNLQTNNEGILFNRSNVENITRHSDFSNKKIKQLAIFKWVIISIIIAYILGIVAVYFFRTKIGNNIKYVFITNGILLIIIIALVFTFISKS